ncbi:MAG: HAD hydrolase family protein [Paramuribaculum sp.]|nr:HAD hydrolase family protein [Paramuribaculum sp.]
MSAINYNLSLIKGIVFDIDGVLSPSTIPIAPDGSLLRMANVKDGFAMRLAAKRGLKIAIISGADCYSVRQRMAPLGITDIYLNASEKLPVLKKWMKIHGLAPEEIAFVGDDIPDIPPMSAVGLPVAPADAATDVKRMARYISPVAGGQGVARDLLEQILKARNLWLEHEDAFHW